MKAPGSPIPVITKQVHDEKLGLAKSQPKTEIVDSLNFTPKHKLDEMPKLASRDMQQKIITA